MRRGTLGYEIDGTYQVEVAGDPYRCWVRFPDGSFAAARHDGLIPLMADLPVWVSSDAGGLRIAAVDAAAGLNPASHARFSGREFEIDDRLWAKLGASAEGLVVSIAPGRVDVEAPHWFGGGEIDLAPLRPAEGEHAWCIIGIDPTALILVAVVGAAQSVTLPLLPAQMFEVAFDWARQIAVCAVRLHGDAADLREADLEALLAAARAAPALSADRLLVDDLGGVVVDDAGRGVYE